jgi:hypothetical protein
MSTSVTYTTSTFGTTGTTLVQPPNNGAGNPILDDRGFEVKESKERAETTAQTTTTTAAVAPPAIQQAATAAQAGAQQPAKSRFWKVIDAICSPFKWIADVFSGIGDFFKELMSEEDVNGFTSPQPVLTPEQRNANELTSNKTQLTQWTAQVDTLENQAKSAKTLITAHDFSTPQKFSEWVQVYNAYSSMESPIYQTLLSKCEVIEGQVKGLKNLVSDKPNSPPPQDPAILKKHCTALEAQQKEHNQLEKRLFTFMTTQGEEIQKLWRDTFDKEIKNIAAALTQIQIATLKDLQTLPQPIANSASLAGYREYCKLFEVIEKRLDATDANPRYKTDFAQCMAQHQLIKNIGGTVSATFDQGLNNLGNTCWMNSALQAFRKSPYLLGKFRSELAKFKSNPTSIKNAKETDAEFNDRVLMLKALNFVFDAMESGNNVRDALTKLEDQMFRSIKNNVVSGELSRDRGRQKDVTVALECFLNVIDYRITPHKKTVKTVKNADGQQVTTENLIRYADDALFTCLPLAIHSNQTFQQLLESEAVQESPITEGTFKTERRYAELPPVLVTSLKRFASDEEAIKELDAIKVTMADAFRDWKPDMVTFVSEKALERMRGISMAQITSKITRPILLQPDDVLDLRKSFLTEELDKDDRSKARYRLVSVIHHEGASLLADPTDKEGTSAGQDKDRGHYTACGIKPDGAWSDMSDSSVKTIEATKKFRENKELNEQDKKELQELNDKVATGYAYIWELIGLDQMVEEGDQKVASEFVGAWPTKALPSVSNPATNK